MGGEGGGGADSTSEAAEYDGVCTVPYRREYTPTVPTVPTVPPVPTVPTVDDRDSNRGGGISSDGSSSSSGGGGARGERGERTALDDDTITVRGKAGEGQRISHHAGLSHFDRDSDVIRVSSSDLNMDTDGGDGGVGDVRGSYESV